jgi:chorismate mutase
MRSILLSLLIGLAIPACGSVAPPPTATKDVASDRAFDGLLGLMRERLVVMHDVARYKWAAKSPIEDRGREKVLLEGVAERGRALGLDPETTRAFFAAQIEAAKLMQQADFRRWEAESRGSQGKSPDLAGVLRPRIDALNRQLLAALARIQGQPRDGAQIRQSANERLSGDGIDEEVREAAIQPLVETGP